MRTATAKKVLSDDRIVSRVPHSNRTFILIWLSVVNRGIESLPLIGSKGYAVCVYPPGHSQRRDPVATFDHSDIRGLGTA
jgi:hypothetical protein